MTNPATDDPRCALREAVELAETAHRQTHENLGVAKKALEDWDVARCGLAVGDQIFFHGVTYFVTGIVPDYYIARPDILFKVCGAKAKKDGTPSKYPGDYITFSATPGDLKNPANTIRW
jgi:hypothetical protein